MDSFDLIVIGAGINGAGIARDAALRGLSVLLLDKGDIGGGTSSWSTRLIHGGLRYLEYAEIGLVRESLREREILLRLAPHLVKPLPLLVPVYQTNKHGMMAIRAGMIAYDLLSYDKSLPHHQILSRQQTMQRFAGLNSEGLLGAALYYDAQVELAERLVLEVALSAKQHGAEIRTYARVDRLVIENGQVSGVEYTNVLTGTAQTARAAVVMNVAGPWVDQVLGRSGMSMPRLIGGTKGSHIVVDPFAGAPPQAMYVEAKTDHRPFFILPWNGRFLIGTTDLRFDGDLDEVSATEEEIEYLISETNRVIPQAGLSREAVLYSYSGIRPLPYAAPGKKEAAITRKHIVRDHAPEIRGLLSIIGGKLTTYRSLADEAVIAVFGKLKRRCPLCRTKDEPLPGAGGTAPAMPDVQTSTRNHLEAVYGGRAAEVAALGMDELLDAETGAIAAEVHVAIRQEMALTLQDILMRRTMIGLNRHVGRNAAAKVASIAAPLLGWDAGRTEREIADYQRYTERFHPRA